MNDLANHYRQENLDDQIKCALDSVINDHKDFDPNIIAAMDQFHIGGAQATRDMLELAQFTLGDRVLDIGCGIGGPARLIAQVCQSPTIGLDLSMDYCLAANLISDQLNVSDQTGFVQGNAIHLPFADNSFDGIWTQHVTMNIENKVMLFSEFTRVLKPGGKLVMYEVFLSSDNTKPPHYPLPWSVEGAHSFLDTPDSHRRIMDTHHFSITHFDCVSTSALLSVNQLLQRFQQNRLNKPNLGILLCEHYRSMMENLSSALTQDVLQVFQIIAQKSEDR